MRTVELRLDIWEHAVQQHRLLEVTVEFPSPSKDTASYSAMDELHKITSGGSYVVTVSEIQLYSKLLRHRILCNPILSTSHDLRAYDPKDVGLVNLRLDWMARLGLMHTLLSLQQIIWMAHSHTGRAMMCVTSDHSNVGILFKHSMPVWSVIPSFDLLSHGSRPVVLDTKYIAMGTSNPQEWSGAWRAVLEKWQIHQVQSDKERVLVADVPVSNEIVRSAESINSVLKNEEACWLRSQQTWYNLVVRSAGKVPIEDAKELSKAVRPAIGFWLFPVETLPKLGAGWFPSKPVFDIRDHHPDLALSCLY
ncbi:hypothetical protein BKA66DRAFT_510055 [Pyrenochaeta sp. MPI-SDFR-AT-0127]|nr:hypothetical protein BKA66DRAFT_510055 [Pyrenochaeta sp. MPI-SDFR-AT-0127]